MAILEQPIAYIIHEQVTQAKPKILHEDTQIYGGEHIPIVIFEAELQDASEFNRNTRKYPKPVLNSGLLGQRPTELMSKKQWFGEAGHPDSSDLSRQIKIESDRISHRINKWWWDNYKVIGDIETAVTNKGIEFARLILIQKIEPAFSLRALGSVRKTKEGNVVESPLDVVTYDWVFYPSHSNAYYIKTTDSSVTVINSDTAKINESLGIVPINEAMAIDFIKDESQNYKTIAEQFGVDKEVISLSEDTRRLIVKTSKGTAHVLVEEYVSNEITNYLSNM